MIRAFRSEWVKLWRPGMAIAAAVIIAFAVLDIVLIFTDIGSPQGGPGPDRFRRALTTADLSAADGFVRVFVPGTTFMGVVVMGIMAMNVAVEFSEATLRNLLVREPRRLVLFGGKLLALASFVAAAFALAYSVALAVAVVLAPRYDVSTSAWFTAAGWGELLAGGGNILAAFLGWGILGAVLAVVFRSPALAVVVGVAYALPLENLLLAFWGDGSRWLPVQLLNTLAFGGASDVSYARAAVLVTMYIALAVVLLLGLVDRRDVNV